MLLLPRQPTTTDLKSFWILFCLTGGGIVIIFGYWVFDSSTLNVIVLLATLVALVAGLLKPALIARPYVYFNGFLRYLLDILVRWISFVVFHFVILSIGLSKGRLNTVQPGPGQTMWGDKTIRNITGTSDDETVSVGGESHKDWLPSFLKWAVKSGNRWLVPLMPFMSLVALLNYDTDKKTDSTDTYTLY